MPSQLYAITDNQLPGGSLLVERVADVIGGGCRLIQYRDKSTDKQRRLREASQLAELCHAQNCTLLINDDIELAKAVSAHGVHLGQEDEPIARARDILGDRAIIGATCHASLELAWRAQSEGADYIAFGRFFSSQTKPEAPPALLDLIGRAKKTLSLPVVAIGGITLDNAAQLVAAGADILAVSHGLFGTEQVRSRTELFCRLLGAEAAPLLRRQISRTV